MTAADPLEQTGFEDGAPRRRSAGLAATGWVLAVLSGLFLVITGFNGLRIFASKAAAYGSDLDYMVGAAFGALLLPVISALLLWLGIHLIRQPRRATRLEARSVPAVSPGGGR